MLFTLVMCPFITQLDIGMINLALPLVSTEYGITTSTASWISSIYIVLISATVLVFGRLGDSFGHIKVLKYGMQVFTVGTILSGAAHNFAFMLCARAIQAFGASAALANSHGAITKIYSHQERGKALGINAAFVALGTLLGPALGGFILSSFSWNMLFYSKVPFCILILIIQTFFLPDERAAGTERIDWKGSLWFFVATSVFFVTLQHIQVLGPGHPLIISGTIITLIFGYTFVLWERRCSYPLLNLRLFRNRLLSTNLYCTIISYTAISAYNLLLPFYFQKARGFSVGESGLFLMLYPAIQMFVAPLSGSLSDRIGGEVLVVTGLLFSFAGLVASSFLNLTTTRGEMIIILILTGLGNGFFQSPNNTLVMLSVKTDRVGVGGSLNALSRNIGNSLGIALASIVLYSGISRLVGYHAVSYIADRPDAFIYGMRNTYLLISILYLTAIVLSILQLARTLRTKRRQAIPESLCKVDSEEK